MYLLATHVSSSVKCLFVYIFAHFPIGLFVISLLIFFFLEITKYIYIAWYWSFVSGSYLLPVCRGVGILVEA